MTGRRFGRLVVLVLIVVVIAISKFSKPPGNNSNVAVKRANSTLDTSPGMQQDRLEFIEKLKTKNIIYKVKFSGQYPHAYVGPSFYTLNIDDKASFVGVISAYYLARNPKSDKVLLFDSRSGKQIGYLDRYGLHLN